MFTGIIEELGTVKSLNRKGAISKLQILAPKISRDTQAGQSICLNGACLTVVEIERESLCFEVMHQTLKRTNLGLLKQESKVNLERAIKVDGRLDGHFVSGHIDATGMVSRKQNKGGDMVMEIDGSEEVLRHIVLRGSVALDGVSLTVSGLKNTTFCVNLTPYTLANTTIGLKKEGDIVNIECDLLAKYIDKHLFQNKHSSVPPVTFSLLKEHGFI
ncbi:MAG: riboflavin synthase [Candidatus Omnitrophica bacterium]|nr:riboflavin synthase [Candidatus Omnitrophota bacterium]